MTSILFSKRHLLRLVSGSIQNSLWTVHSKIIFLVPFSLFAFGWRLWSLRLQVRPFFQTRYWYYKDGRRNSNFLSVSRSDCRQDKVSRTINPVETLTVKFQKSSWTTKIPLLGKYPQMFNLDLMLPNLLSNHLTLWLFLSSRTPTCGFTVSTDSAKVKNNQPQSIEDTSSLWPKH